MKAKLAVALATLLSVADAFAQQYILPIGSNVNNRNADVGVSIYNRDTGWYVSDEFKYTPAMGDLETVVKNRLQKLADNFVPPQGSLNDSYSIGLGVDPGPYQTPRVFTLQQDGTIPPEVLEVKLQYGEVTLELNGVTKVELRVRGNGREERFSSDGSSEGSVCFIQTVDRELGKGLVILAKEYVNPQYRASWITEGEVILWENERLVEFNILDGKDSFVSAKAPDFLNSLRAPEILSQSQAPVLVLASPKISRIARIGNTTEITVSAEKSGNAHLEFAEALSGTWNAVPAYPAPLALKAGSTQFTHTIESPTAFYRLRIAESPKGQ